MKLKDTIHFNWYKQVLMLLLLVICLYGSIQVTEANFQELLTNTGQMHDFLLRFAHPDFSYLPKIVMPLLKTIQMSILGTAIGLFLAVPVAFLATQIVTKNLFVTMPVRFLLGLIRTIPNLLLAALLVALIGIGEVTGVLTIAIFTFGMVSQLVYQAIETVDYGPIEAAEAVGANKIQVAIWSIAPQILNQVASYAFYSFEVNIRASTVLGYVGAGGIGVILNASLALFQYERVSMIILVILLMVASIDWLSERIRRRLL